VTFLKRIVVETKNGPILVEVLLDMDRIDGIARKAAHNKVNSSRSGPVLAKVVKVPSVMDVN